MTVRLRRPDGRPRRALPVASTVDPETAASGDLVGQTREFPLAAGVS
jgi:hypothetical protein